MADLSIIVLSQKSNCVIALRLLVYLYTTNTFFSPLILQVKEIVPLVTTGSYDVANPCAVQNSFSHARFRARCDMETDEGGWLVIQRRINGSVDFYRNWTDYVHGFGDLEGEFWYGLENIHCLTTREDVELRIEVGNETTPSIVWTYQLFRVGGAETNYVLTVGEGQGTGRDNFTPHSGRPFSTRDHDNDSWGRNCAAVYGGAWWYAACFSTNLNGKYTYHIPEDGGSYNVGANKLSWYDGSNWQNSIYTKAEMKIRPKRAGCGASSSNTCK